MENELGPATSEGASGGGSTVDEREVFIQACETARHYGNMRFLMFTVFTGILGALLVVELNHFERIRGRGLRVGFRTMALLLSVMFTVAELRIAMLVATYQERTLRHVALPGAHRFWKVVIPSIMCAPFVLAAVLWAWLLASGAHIPVIE